MDDISFSSECIVDPNNTLLPESPTPPPSSPSPQTTPTIPPTGPCLVSNPHAIGGMDSTTQSLSNHIA